MPDEIGPVAARVVEGAIPQDLRNGALLRNGPNARRWGMSGGWLDGDGMVHACVFGDEPTYTRRWLRTEAFAKEEAAGRGLFDGSLVAPFGFKLLGNLAKNLVRAKQPQKDTANTALLALKNGRVLGLMEQCRPCEFRIYEDGAIETVRPGSTLDGGLGFWSHPLSGGALTAHLHASTSRPHEAVGATYSSSDQPFCRIDVVDLASGRVTKTDGVELRCPVMLHDCALAGDDVVIFDFPLTVRPARMLSDKFPVRDAASNGSRRWRGVRHTP